MLKRWGLIGAAIGLVIVIGVGYAFFREPEDATAPIRALPIQTDEQVDAAGNTEDQSGSIGVEAEPSIAAGERLLFVIDPTQSEVRFKIDEILRGEPNTVVGITNQVSGEIAIDPSDFGNTQLGTFQVNARTIATDNSLRDRAIRNRILDTNEFEFISFVPVEILNLPLSVNLGESFRLQVIGELSIRDITREETFEVTVTPISESRMEGFASTVILRSNYGITIPTVQQVADVGKEVFLEIEFVATT